MYDTPKKELQPNRRESYAQHKSAREAFQRTMESTNHSNDCADDALKLFAEAAASVTLQSTEQSSMPLSGSSSSSAAPKEKVMTDVEKKRRERRLMMNRITARERRKRKRELIDELQETVKELKAKNVSLTESHYEMKKKLARLEGKNKRICRCGGQINDGAEQNDGVSSSVGSSQEAATSDVKFASGTSTEPVAEKSSSTTAPSEVSASIPSLPITAGDEMTASSAAAAAAAARARLEYQTKMGLVRDMLGGVGPINHSLPFLQLQQAAMGGLSPFLSTPSSTLLSALTGASSACAPSDLGLPQQILGAAAGAPLIGRGSVAPDLDTLNR